MALDWAHTAQGCQPHRQSYNPLDLRGKGETWLTEDNLAKNCGSRNEENEPQLGHHPEAGQWQKGVDELHCCLTCQQAWQIVMMMLLSRHVTSFTKRHKKSRKWCRFGGHTHLHSLADAKRLLPCPEKKEENCGLCLHLHICIAGSGPSNFLLAQLFFFSGLHCRKWGLIASGCS